MPFRFQRLEIPDVVLIEATTFPDDRGFFQEIYRCSDFVEFGIDVRFAQSNHSRSKRDVVRGLHYQLEPRAQGKLVRTTTGALYAVAVDIRVGSPWYSQFVGAELSDDNDRMLWIPTGFAHGMCVLEDETDVIYLLTAEYWPDGERGIDPADEAIGVDWPIPLERMVVSERDRTLPSLDDAENNFVWSEPERPQERGSGTGRRGQRRPGQR